MEKNGGLLIRIQDDVEVAKGVAAMLDPACKYKFIQLLVLFLVVVSFQNSRSLQSSYV